MRKCYFLYGRCLIAKTPTTVSTYYETFISINYEQDMMNMCEIQIKSMQKGDKFIVMPTFVTNVFLASVDEMPASMCVL